MIGIEDEYDVGRKEKIPMMRGIELEYRVVWIKEPTIRGGLAVIEDDGLLPLCYQKPRQRQLAPDAVRVWVDMGGQNKVLIAFDNPSTFLELFIHESASRWP